MSYEKLEQKFDGIVKKHHGSDAGERRIKIAAQILKGTRKGEVSMEWALQVMKRLHGSVSIE